MKGVYSVFTEYRSEKLIERSRFISTCLHVESEEEARAFLARVRTEFPDATHHCYAFVADTLGNLMRFSDDGEPQGTAGMPFWTLCAAKNSIRRPSSSPAISAA